MHAARQQTGNTDCDFRLRPKIGHIGAVRLDTSVRLHGAFFRTPANVAHILYVLLDTQTFLLLVQSFY